MAIFYQQPLHLLLAVRSLAPISSPFIGVPNNVVIVCCHQCLHIAVINNAYGVLCSRANLKSTRVAAIVAAAEEMTKREGGGGESTNFT